MTILTKTSLIFFLLVNIVCVTYGPKGTTRYEGQSSGSKNEKINVNSEENKEEEEEIEDPQFKINLQRCETELFKVFKHEDPFDNFCEGLLNINGQDYVTMETYAQSTRYYYYDLFITLQTLNLPRFISPKKYCNKHFKKKAKKCINVINDAGCNVDADGNSCIQHLYFNWKLRDASSSVPIPGTEGISDEALLQAIFSGYLNPYNLADQDLLEAYYTTHQRLSEEEIIDYYELYLIRGGTTYNYETFRGLILLSYNQNFLEQDLREARYERFGVHDASYFDLFREYLRRDNLAYDVYYDNHYANFLIEKIKKHDCSQFKSLTKYCKEYLKMRNEQSDL